MERTLIWNQPLDFGVGDVGADATEAEKDSSHRPRMLGRAMRQITAGTLQENIGAALGATSEQSYRRPRMCSLEIRPRTYPWSAPVIQRKYVRAISLFCKLDRRLMA
jgi:hypothetical protein